MIKIQITWYEDFVNKVWHIVVDWYTNDAIKKSIINFQRTAIKETPVDTGNMRTSYDTRFWHLEWELRNTKEYGVFVHEPTRPHWTKAENLQGWADRHGIPVGAVQRSIAKKGTKGNPWMTRTLEKEAWSVEVIFNNEFSKLLKKLSSNG